MVPRQLGSHRPRRVLWARHVVGCSRNGGGKEGLILGFTRVAAPRVAASPETVAVAHARCVAEAERVAGTTVDARARAAHYFALYEASQGNFLFPLIATHGSLWGVTHTVRIERALRRLQPLSRRGRIRRWIDALDAVRDINRRVFIEVHSTFHFTRTHGQREEARHFVKPAVLEPYNRVHEAVRRAQPLTTAQRRDLYYEVFVHEQIDIVDPGIQEAAAACGSAVMVRVLKHVRPRFRYFPPGERLHFTDFTSIDQRNAQGLRAHDLAVRVGPARVRQAMDEYPEIQGEGRF